MPEFSADELDLIEQVLQDKEEAYRDDGLDDDSSTGFVVGDCRLAVGEFKKMVSRICGKIHGIEVIRFCPDCGEEGAPRGHYGCQFPTDIEDALDTSLEDPMEVER